MVYSFPDPLKETGNLSLKGDSSSATIEYIIPWADLQDAADSVLNGFIPAFHYMWPGLIVKNMSYQPLGDFTDTNFNQAKIVLTFGPPDDNDEDDQQPGNLGQVSLSISGESVSLPRGHFKWDNSGGDDIEDDDIQPHKVIPQSNLQITVENLNALDLDQIDSTVGKVNNAPFQVESKSYSTGQVLFVGANTSHGVTTDGIDNFSVQYNFMVHAESWQKLWDAEQGQWRTVFPQLYQTANLNGLF